MIRPRLIEQWKMPAPAELFEAHGRIRVKADTQLFGQTNWHDVPGRVTLHLKVGAEVFYSRRLLVEGVVLHTIYDVVDGIRYETSKTVLVA